MKEIPRNPVSMFWFTVTLEVVLSTGKVPHEVTPIHEITLVREEENEGSQAVLAS